jgi:multidrug efflux pump subunit AcrA (membrane-fusion protein)
MSTPNAMTTSAAALRARYDAVSSMVAERIADSETNFTGYTFEEFGETAAEVADQLNQAQVLQTLLSEAAVALAQLQNDTEAALAAAQSAVDAAHHAFSDIDALNDDVGMIEDPTIEADFLSGTIEELQDRLAVVSAGKSMTHRPKKGTPMTARAHRSPAHVKSLTASEIETVVDELVAALEYVEEQMTNGEITPEQAIDKAGQLNDQMNASSIDADVVAEAAADDPRYRVTLNSMEGYAHYAQRVIDDANRMIADRDADKSTDDPAAEPFDLSTPENVVAALQGAELGGELEPDEMEIVAGFIATENPEISDIDELTRIYDAAVRRMLAEMEPAA